MSSATPDRIKEASGRRIPAGETSAPVAGTTNAANSANVPAGNLSAQESQTRRQEKLNSIRQAIDSGAYDSDKLLAQAMDRMREAIENEEQP